MPPVVLGAVALGGAAIAAGGVAAAFAATGLVGFAASFGASMLLSAAAQAMMPAPSLGQMEMKARTVTVREPVMPRAAWGSGVGRCELRPVFRTVCLLTLRCHFPSHIFESLFWRFVADA
jgi:hypothetical protein